VATIAAPAGVTDDQPGNDSATDVDELVFTILGWDFFTATPCRLLDTRTNGGPLLSGVERLLDVDAAPCAIPATAKAVALNVTVTQGTGAGHVTGYPVGGAVPGTSVLNFGAGQTRANNAVIALSADGTARVGFRAFVVGAGSVHVIVDVVGWFE
jgi:hypothetical protein